MSEAFGMNAVSIESYAPLAAATTAHSSSGSNGHSAAFAAPKASLDVCMLVVVIAVSILPGHYNRNQQVGCSGHT
jgi:hypothetical protein